MHAHATAPRTLNTKTMHHLARHAARQIQLIKHAKSSAAVAQHHHHNYPAAQQRFVRQQRCRVDATPPAAAAATVAVPPLLPPYNAPLALRARPLLLPLRPAISQRRTRAYSSNSSSSSSSTNDSTRTSTSTFDEQGADANAADKPLVLVAGWLGAAARPFSKYVDLWRGRLCARQVLEARPHPAALIVPPIGAAAAARDAAALASAARGAPETSPLFVHVFSGGGFLYFGLVLQALQKSGELAAVAPRLAGIVLDSSPAYVTGDVTARALLAAALRESAAGIEARHPRALAALRAGVDFYLSLPPTRARLAAATSAWHALAPAGPRLYLYSETDALVGPETIQAHMAAEAERGARVAAHRWRDTPHVEHFRMHPEEYTGLVGAFAAEAAAEWRRARGWAAGEGGSVSGSSSSGSLSSSSSSSSLSSSSVSSSGGKSGSAASGAAVVSSGGSSSQRIDVKS